MRTRARYRNDLFCPRSVYTLSLYVYAFNEWIALFVAPGCSGTLRERNGQKLTYYQNNLKNYETKKVLSASHRDRPPPQQQLAGQFPELLSARAAAAADAEVASSLDWSRGQQCSCVMYYCIYMYCTQNAFKAFKKCIDNGSICTKLIRFEFWTHLPFRVLQAS